MNAIGKEEQRRCGASGRDGCRTSIQLTRESEASPFVIQHVTSAKLEAQLAEVAGQLDEQRWKKAAADAVTVAPTETGNDIETKEMSAGGKRPKKQATGTKRALSVNVRVFGTVATSRDKTLPPFPHLNKLSNFFAHVQWRAAFRMSDFCCSLFEVNCRRAPFDRFTLANGPH